MTGCLPAGGEINRVTLDRMEGGAEVNRAEERREEEEEEEVGSEEMTNWQKE